MFALRRQAILIGLVVLLDQVTKSWAVSALDNGRVIHVVGSLQFSLGFNSGFAFSQGQGIGPIVGVFALVAVLFLLRAVRKATTQLSALALCAIVAGAIGNIADRFFRGEGWLHGRVVDFIDLQWWPVFNVADSSITVGACALIAAMLMEARNGKGVDNAHES
ncbi:MAG: signal peptidase II [Ilumatobacteraceae bacterium]